MSNVHVYSENEEHSQINFKSSATIEDNPIAEMMAMKHPELQKNIEEADIAEMSMSYNKGASE